MAMTARKRLLFSKLKKAAGTIEGFSSCWGYCGAENWITAFSEAGDHQLVGQHLHLHHLRGEVQAPAGAVHGQVVPLPQVGHGGGQPLQEEPVRVRQVGDGHELLWKHRGPGMMFDGVENK